MQWDAPDSVDTGGGNWLKEPGTYHAIVIDTRENPTSKSGSALDAFQVTFQVLEGTVKDQQRKTIDITFWNPKLTDKNEGLFARQKQAKFFIATGLLDEQQLGQTGLQIKLDAAVGRQVVLTVDWSSDDKKYLDLNYADIWHIDDPAAANFPKCEETLKLLPSNHRRAPKSFRERDGGESGPSGQQPTGTSASETVDLSDL